MSQTTSNSDGNEQPHSFQTLLIEKQNSTVILQGKFGVLSGNKTYSYHKI